MVQLCFTQLTVHFGLVGIVGKLGGLLDVLKVVEDDSDGFNRLVELLVDGESLIVERVLRLLRDTSELKAIEVVKTVDVLLNAGGLRSDSSQDQQVLQAPVVGKVRVVQHNSFE